MCIYTCVYTYIIKKKTYVSYHIELYDYFFNVAFNNVYVINNIYEYTHI